MATPSLRYVAPPVVNPQPNLEPEPVIIYGLPDAPVGPAPTFAEIPGTVAGVQGAHLQAVLNDIATRLAAVETP